MAAIRKLWLLAVVLPATPALADSGDGLDLSGTIRLRYEGISNQPRAGLRQDDGFVSLRTTLAARYQSGGFTAFAELWDSRVYAEKADSALSTGEVNTIEPVQAYVAWKGTVDGAKVSIQAGRTMLNMGSRRLVAADDYRNTTNGYTGLKLDLATTDGVGATAVYMLPQQRRPDDTASLHGNKVGFDHEGFDEVLWGGLVSKAKALGPVMAELGFYHFGEHDLPGRPTRDRSLDSYDARLIRAPAPGRWDGELEFIYQGGSISASTAANAPRQGVAAWFVHAATGFSIPGALKARLAIEYDRASGDAAGGHYTHFDTLFAMRRSDFAPAALYNAITRANISSPGLRVEIAPSPRWDAFATYRALWLVDRTDSFASTGVRDPNGRSGAFAGNQFDARFRWWLQPARYRFEVDGTVLAKGRFLEDAPNAPPGGTTAYASVNLSAFF